MTTPQTPSAAIPEPPGWAWPDVFRHLTRELASRQLLRGTAMPAIRVHHQLEQDQTIAAIGERWPGLDAAARADAWPDLIQAGYDATKEPLPVCVRCGECCRRSSPTLYAEDAELVLEKLIPPSALYTLRRGEPVRSPFQKEPFHLLEECIKVREKPGHGGCLFFDEAENACTIYDNRPLQCRAQACWDPSVAEELAEEPKITRKALFGGLEELISLLEEHDERCGFTRLREVFDDLEKSEGQSIDAVVEAVAYEDHFRNFVTEQLNLPPDTVDLFFGRSFAQLVRLFGFEVEREADGTNVLKPIETSPPPA